MNFSINIDLLKIRGAFVQDLKGKEGDTKCLIIPIKEAGCLFQGKKGLYLNMTAVENKEEKFGQTHYIKSVAPRVEGRRKETMILGGLKELSFDKSDQPTQRSAHVESPSSYSHSSQSIEDLPF